MLQVVLVASVTRSFHQSQWPPETFLVVESVVDDQKLLIKEKFGNMKAYEVHSQPHYLHANLFS